MDQHLKEKVLATFYEQKERIISIKEVLLFTCPI